MKSTAAAVTDNALHLPRRQRASLAHKLIQSLETGRDVNAGKEWADVIARRSAEIEEGRVVCRTAEEVFADLRKKRAARRRK